MKPALSRQTGIHIPEVILLNVPRVGDERGFFSETFNKNSLQKKGIIADFVQDNHSLSAELNVIRGLHFQTPPFAQDKLVRVTRGSVFDVAVDIRHGSPTFGEHISVVLSAENWNQLWIPKGFAHAFCTLEPNTEFVYKVTEFYAPENEVGLAWDDPALSIKWPLAPGKKPILSEKDSCLPLLENLPEYFTYDNINGVRE